MKRILALAAAASLLSLVALAWVGYEEHAHETGWSVGPAHSSPVKQPLVYSHKIHVGERAISCTYCHQFADKADYAGIPPMETCLHCHRGVDTDRLENTSMTATDKKAEIAKFLVRDPKLAEMLGEPGAVALKEPTASIHWKRVFDLPAHVKFPHQVHVWALMKDPENAGRAEALAKKIPGLGDVNTAATCIPCHGDIGGMQVVKQEVDLIRMGTCLSCHHKTGAVTDCFGCHF
ncbi:MAG: cytochrome c3 family protein [Candidatus Sericytochromatia bacterium]|nr:cytochrome c3 family protein [Candidatus Tanganyikabacteria bacterium]